MAERFPNRLALFDFELEGLLETLANQLGYCTVGLGRRSQNLLAVGEFKDLPRRAVLLVKQSFRRETSPRPPPVC